MTLSNLKFLEAKDELEVLENDQISKNLCQIRMCSDKGIFQCSKCKLVVCTEHELHGAHRPLPKTKLCAIIDISNTSIPSSIQKEKEESKSENKSVIELDKEEEEEVCQLLQLQQKGFFQLQVNILYQIQKNTFPFSHFLSFFRFDHN